MPFAPSYTQSAEMVQTYVHNSELQRRWACCLIARQEFTGHEKILDFGCRDGRITADLGRFVPFGSVDGMDYSKEAISWARRQFHESEYPNVSFHEGGVGELFPRAQYDVIFSCCALQFYKEPEKVLLGLRDSLADGGRLIATFPASGNTAWRLANEEMRASDQWNAYWKGFKPAVWKGTEEWRQLLLEAGFEIKRLEKVSTMDPFLSKEEWVEWLKGVYPPVIPRDLQDAFFSQCIERYTEHDPSSIGEGGLLYAKFGRIEIEAVKLPH